MILRRVDDREKTVANDERAAIKRKVNVLQGPKIIAGKSDAGHRRGPTPRWRHRNAGKYRRSVRRLEPVVNLRTVAPGLPIIPSRIRRHCTKSQPDRAASCKLDWRDVQVGAFSMLLVMSVRSFVAMGRQSRSRAMDEAIRSGSDAQAPWQRAWHTGVMKTWSGHAFAITRVTVFDEGLPTPPG